MRKILSNDGISRVPMSAIRRFAREVAKKFNPEKIILFGSYAYGRHCLAFTECFAAPIHQGGRSSYRTFPFVTISV